MEIMRVVITGPVGAGKSTFIRSISEIEVVDTDCRATELETTELKQNTTVAFDFGRLQFCPDMALHIYGTPGQERFDFMWDILIDRAHAYILLVAANRPQQFRQARRIISFMNQRVDLPMIIGLTHSDLPEAWATEDVMSALGYTDLNHQPPVVTVNPNEQSSVIETAIALIEQLTPTEPTV
ncbi:MAG: ATP/GTP-binding protein [Tatlockia sp.]|nr:ATP/GTP-binding protein [Tatlockia sp.]